MPGPPSATRAVESRFAAWRRRMRPPRRLKFTREGKFFVGITLGVGFAAINTANNLLYLLLGMLLALIVVSGIMSELSLRDLTVVRRLPLRAQVGPRAPRRDRGLSTTSATFPRTRSRSRTCARASRPTSAASSSRSARSRRRSPPIGGRRCAAVATCTSASASPHAFPSGSSRSRARCRPTGSSSSIPPSTPCSSRRPPRARARRGLRRRPRARRGVLRPEADAPGRGPARHPLAKDRRRRARSSCASARARRGPTSSSTSTRCAPPPPATNGWPRFERRIRDVASRAVAHLKRGDRVAVVTTTGGA